MEQDEKMKMHYDEVKFSPGMTRCFERLVTAMLT